MQWLTPIIFALFAIIPTRNCKTTEIHHQVCHLYVEETTTLMLDFKSSKINFIPLSRAKNIPLFPINESVSAATEQVGEKTKLFSAFRGGRHFTADVKVLRICVLTPANSTASLQLQANWTNQIHSGGVGERGDKVDCLLPRIGLWQESAQSDFRSLGDSKPRHKSRRLKKRGSGHLTDLISKLRHSNTQRLRKCLDKRGKNKKHRKLMKNKSATKWSSFRQRRIDQALDLERLRPKHRRKESKNRQLMPSIHKSKNLKSLKKSRLKPARTGRKRRRHTRSLPRDAWFEVFSICNSVEDRLIYTPLSDTNQSESMEVSKIERLEHTALSLQTKAHKFVVEIQWNAGKNNALKKQRNLIFQFLFSPSHETAEVSSPADPQMTFRPKPHDNKTIVDPQNDRLGGNNTNGPTSRGPDAANLSIILVCIACSVGIVVVFCKCYRRTRKHNHAKPQGELSSDTEWTELSSDGCREVACEQAELFLLGLQKEMPGLLATFRSAIQQLKPKFSNSETSQYEKTSLKSEQLLKVKRSQSLDCLLLASCLGGSKNRLPEDMTQSRSCCCAGKYKNFKPTTKQCKTSQHNADFLNQCQHQTKKSQKLRRKRDTKLCCCGKLPDHMTSESSDHLTNGRRPNNDTGSRTRQDQSCFSKYNGLINNPHRQECAISPSILSARLPVVAQSYNRRFPKHEGGGAIESTCHKPPPNRAIIKNDGHRITSISYGEYQVNDVTGRCHLTDQRSNISKTSENLPKYSREDNSTFPAENLPHYRGVVHHRSQSPPFESTSLLSCERTYSPRSATDDLPPEYSEPPAYSA